MNKYLQKIAEDSEGMSTGTKVALGAGGLLAGGLAAKFLHNHFSSSGAVKRVTDAAKKGGEPASNLIPHSSNLIPPDTSMFIGHTNDYLPLYSVSKNWKTGSKRRADGFKAPAADYTPPVLPPRQVTLHQFKEGDYIPYE